MAASNKETSQFYIPDSRQAFIEKVQAGLSQKKIVVIEGPTGIGKTVVLEEVLTQTLPNANKCYVTPTRGMTDIQIRSRVIEQLFGNVLFDPEMPMLTSFIEFSQPQQILIAMDNCQFLSGRIVGELLQLFSEAGNLGIELTIVLALDKSLNSTLLNVNSSLVRVLTVPTLNKQESYQLMVEYIEGIPAQTNSKIKRWIDNAGGLPIQLLGYNEQSGEGQAEDDSPLNLKLWVSLLVLASLILALGVYVYRKGLEQPLEVKEEVSLPVEVEQKPGNQQVVTDWNKSKQEEKEPETEFELEEKPMAHVTAMPTASSEVILAEILGEKNKAETVEEKIEAKQVEQNSTTDLILSELTKEQVRLSEEQQREAENDLLSELQQEDLTETSNSQRHPPQNELRNNQRHPSENELEDVPESSLNESGEIKSTYPAYFIDNQVFMSLPADRFVLQLTAVSNEAVLSEYLSSAPVPVDELRIYQIKRKQSDWIVVTYGLYENIEQARLAAKKIEPNAWAKSISVIQQQILAFQKAQE